MLPGIATDALVRESIVRREPHAGYTVVRCSERPDYWFANCLILDRETEPEHYEDWLEVARRAFSGVPVQRRVVLWEIAGRQGLRPYAGRIERECTTIFTTRIALGRPAPDVEIRPPASGRDWQRASELVAADVAGSSIQGQADFERWRFGVYRRDAGRGRCNVWGAWIGDEIVAVAGVYTSDAWIRFITPVTEPAHRSRGYFSALAHAALTDALARHPGASVVIAAQTGGPAENVYDRLGFHRAGEQHALIGEA